MEIILFLVVGVVLYAIMVASGLVDRSEDDWSKDIRG